MQSSEISSASAFGGSGNDKLICEGDAGLEGNDGNDYLFGCAFQEGNEGDDILEGRAGGATYYNGGPDADTFKCSSGPRDIVEDYNPEEGDVVSEECETINS